jgi:hypothetical protein
MAALATFRISEIREQKTDTTYMDAADMRVVEKFRSIDIYITQNHDLGHGGTSLYRSGHDEHIRRVPFRNEVLAFA